MNGQLVPMGAGTQYNRYGRSFRVRPMVEMKHGQPVGIKYELDANGETRIFPGPVSDEMMREMANSQSTRGVGQGSVRYRY